jgi:probable HAF family extracellular repeat protein
MPSYLLKMGLVGGMVIAIGGSTLGSFLSVGTASTQFSYEVKDLGTLNGYISSYANAINNAGQVVGYSQTSNGNTHAVLWRKGNKIDLGTLGGTNSSANGINNTGQVVGYSQTSSGNTHAVLWHKGNKIDLGTLNGDISSTAKAINNTGKVVGSSSTSGATHAVLWRKGNKIDLGTLGGSVSSAYGINKTGKVVGYSRPSSGTYRAVLWDKRNIIDLEPLSDPFTDSIAYSINNAGKVVGGIIHNPIGISLSEKAVLWNKGNKIILPCLKDINCFAISINNTDQVVGYSQTIPGPGRGEFHAVLWDKGSIKDLNNLIPPNSGWELKEARSINDRGQIVGSGKINGHNHAFLLTPVRRTR